ncbi:uncharacterized protein [Anabrus simplex]|uniref:uncharacterized protein n=1 Tax=Anabrus simplex TaxID=316456 RepID=UPI0034DD2FCA
MGYPFALVLRLRVLQVVCGICVLVMGTVGFIEERGEMNLGLGIPAGAVTVLAAGASIHTSRGFGGYRPSSCSPALRFLGPSAQVAGPLAVLWSAACALHVALLVQAIRTLTDPASKDVVVLASVQMSLTALTLAVVLVVLRIDCRHDPD